MGRGEDKTMFEVRTRIGIRRGAGGGHVAGAAEEEELRQKFRALAASRFGDYTLPSMKKLFQSYDGDGDGVIGRVELKAMLKDADVGNGITRGYWVDGIFEALDKSPADDRLSWDEYMASLKPEDMAAGKDPLATADDLVKASKSGTTGPASTANAGENSTTKRALFAGAAGVAVYFLFS